jgi:hypothetical protein
LRLLHHSAFRVNVADLEAEVRRMLAGAAGGQYAALRDLGLNVRRCG